jgi:ubiquinone/menaquinone biosynthesis C-methylase UbiE
MDVRDLKYEDNSFDLAIDKSTIDALLCGDNSYLNVAIMTKEIQRILKVGGIYMIVSYGQPENRTFHIVILFNFILEILFNFFIISKLKNLKKIFQLN